MRWIAGAFPGQSSGGGTQQTNQITETARWWPSMSSLRIWPPKAEYNKYRVTYFLGDLDGTPPAPQRKVVAAEGRFEYLKQFDLPENPESAASSAIEMAKLAMGRGRNMRAARQLFTLGDLGCPSQTPKPISATPHTSCNTRPRYFTAVQRADGQEKPGPRQKKGVFKFADLAGPAIFPKR